ncbi:hypothetical protein HB852_09955 [Listeria grandensis]|uniref:hypothetical protein n=1 Tax=Listeria grandensis TaxID=1494963 RepID=UPI00162A877D|nr:hypothetical protein [Listeria grandensis]MBC1474941.1 hypothetical protein [Listeria grandensis]
MKLVVNRCYGGYVLSSKAVLRVLDLKRKTVFAYVQTNADDLEREAENFKRIDKTFEEGAWDFISYFDRPLDLCMNGDISYDELRHIESIDTDFDRDDPELLQVVEELGIEASTVISKLEIIEIPDNHEYYIDDYDGVERVVSGVDLHINGERMKGART